MSERTLTEAELARIGQLIGIELDEASRGQVKMHLDARDDLRQVNDVLHGGSIASLIDTAAAFAVITLIEPGQSATTTDLTIHFLRPVDAGRITAVARVLRSGRRLLVVRIDVFDSSQNLISTAVTTYIRISPSPSSTQS